MDGLINTDIQALRIIYNRNKYYLIPFVVILICIGLVIQIVIPQFKTFLQVKEEAKTASLKLDKLKKDLNILESLDGNILMSQFETSIIGLPVNKDFGGILNALYSAEQISGVSIGKFSFQLGDLESGGEKDTNFSAINLTISLNEDIVEVNRFIDAITKSVPLSNVSVVRVGDKASMVSLMFYYKVLPALSTQKDLPIIPVSQEKAAVLGKIKDFTNILLTNVSLKPATPSVKTTNPFVP